MGGNIRAESIRQKGSIFYFTLPAIIPVAQPQLKNQPAIIQDSMASYNWKGKKILVVEDEDFVIKFINKCITPTGAELVFVKNGLAAVKSFREQSGISLILMDIKLPELNGFEAVKRIRQINTKIPIIAETAYAMIEDRNKCIEAGCNDYIAKPLDPELLMFKINNLI